MQIFFSKKTHLGRSVGRKICVDAGLDESAINSAGRWNQKTQSGSYGCDDLELKACRALAGFNPDSRQEYLIARATCFPSESLLKKVFPWLEEAKLELDPRSIAGNCKS